MCDLVGKQKEEPEVRGKQRPEDEPSAAAGKLSRKRLETLVVDFVDK